MSKSIIPPNMTSNQSKASNSFMNPRQRSQVYGNDQCPPILKGSLREVRDLASGSNSRARTPKLPLREERLSRSRPSSSVGDNCHGRIFSDKSIVKKRNRVGQSDKRALDDIIILIQNTEYLIIELIEGKKPINQPKNLVSMKILSCSDHAINPSASITIVNSSKNDFNTNDIVNNPSFKSDPTDNNSILNNIIDTNEIDNVNDDIADKNIIIRPTTNLNNSKVLLDTIKNNINQLYNKIQTSSSSFDNCTLLKYTYSLIDTSLNIFSTKQDPSFKLTIYRLLNGILRMPCFSNINSKYAPFQLSIISHLIYDHFEISDTEFLNTILYSAVTAVENVAKEVYQILNIILCGQNLHYFTSDQLLIIMNIIRKISFVSTSATLSPQNKNFFKQYIVNLSTYDHISFIEPEAISFFKYFLQRSNDCCHSLIIHIHKHMSLRNTETSVFCIRLLADCLECLALKEGITPQDMKFLSRKYLQALRSESFVVATAVINIYNEVLVKLNLNNNTLISELISNIDTYKATKSLLVWDNLNGDL